MTIEEQLDLVLSAFYDKDRGSHIWYKVGQEDDVVTGLIAKGLDEKFMLQFLLHVQEDGYVTLFYEDNPSGWDMKHREEEPKQAKITGRGRIFITNGGYVKQTKSTKNKEAVHLIGILAGVIVGIYYLFLLFVEFLIPTFCHCLF